MKKFVLSILIVVSTPLLLKSTCIIIYVKNNQIYVSADSRMTITKRTKLETPAERETRDTCKIIKVGQIYHSVSGHLIYQLYWYARKVSERGYSIDKTAHEFGEVVSIFYQKEIEKYRGNQAYYRQQHPASGLAHVAFFGFENNKAVVKLVEFGLLNKPWEPVTVDFNVKDVVDAKVLGSAIASKKYIDSARLTLQSDKTKIFSIMESAIRKEMPHNLGVGGKINKLRLSSKGAEWVQGKPMCN